MLENVQLVSGFIAVVSVIISIAVGMVVVRYINRKNQNSIW